MSINVGLFNDSFLPTIDGVANCVKNYADIINDGLGKAAVITPEYPNVIDDYDYPVFRYSSVKFKGRMPYRVGNPFSPSTILELKKQKFDILHVHCPFASAVLAQEIKNKRTPTIFTYHTKFDIDIDNFVKNSKFNVISKKFILNNIKKADEIWCVSKGAIDSLHALGYKGEAIVMPNGTDFQKGKADYASIQEIKRTYDLHDEIPTLIFCGRIMWYKNLKLIIDGLSLLRKSGIKFKALFIGDGPDRPYIEKYSRCVGLNETYLTYIGSVYDREKIRAFFSCADLLLFPSTYDTSGLVVKEAAACECSAILVEGSCAAEGITDGKNGLLIKETPEAFADSIAKAINSDGLFKKMGKNALDTVYYSWKDSINTAFKRYEFIIDNYKK